MAGVIGNGGSNGQNTGGGSTGGTGGNDVSKVPLTRKINQYTLDKDILLTSTDVGALPLEKTSINGSLPVLNTSTGRYEWTIADTGGSGNDDTKVPLTRTVNGKALSTDITITSSDVQALGINATLINGTAPALNTSTGKYEWTIADTGGSGNDDTKVPLTRTINTKPLSTDIVLNARDVGALTSNTVINGVQSIYSTANGRNEFTISSTDNTKVPLTRTVNAKPLSSNITLTASDVGALSILNTKINGASPVLDNGTGEYRWSISTSGSPDWSRLVVAGRSPVDTGNGLFQVPLGPVDVGAVSYSNTKINNKFFGGTLAAPVLDLTPEDVGSLPVTRTHINGTYPQYNSITKQYGWSISTGTDTTKVPLTRTINNISLANDIILSAVDIGALPLNATVINGTLPVFNSTNGRYEWTVAGGGGGDVPSTRTINGLALTSNITLDNTHVNALKSDCRVNGKAFINTGQTYKEAILTAEDVDSISRATTINGYRLITNPILEYQDVGAVKSGIRISGKQVTDIDVDIDNIDTRSLHRSATINGKSFVGQGGYTPSMVLTSTDIGSLPASDTTVNGFPFTFNNTTSKWEVTIPPQSGGVIDTRRINGYRLNQDISLNAADVGALQTTGISVNGVSTALDAAAGPNKFKITLNPLDIGAAARTTTVNGQPLTSNITLNSGDVGAVPVGRKINGLSLGQDINLTYGDVGALPIQKTYINGSKAVVDGVTGDISWNIAIPSDAKNLKNDNTKINGALPTLNAGTGAYEWTVTAAATIPTKIEQTVNATGTQVPNKIQISKDQIDIVGSGTVYVTAAAGATTKLRVIGEGSFAGAVDMLSMSITSDERVKSNIVSMDEVSAMMRNIELRKYTKAGKTEYGLIAQQAESVGAKFINHKDEDLLSVDLYDYVAHVHKYVQELEKKIDELTKKDK